MIRLRIADCGLRIADFFDHKTADKMGSPLFRVDDSQPGGSVGLAFIA
jgi:hypothetical protein